jgi:FixJ family two-component response regulator
MLQTDMATATATAIAIIDPDQASRASLTRLLQAHGYRPMPFAAMAEYAVHVKETAAAPVLLVDVHEFLNTSGGTRKALLGGSIVITLGNGMRLKEIGQALVAGCIDYLVRPVPSTLLLATMAQAMGRIRLR